MPYVRIWTHCVWGTKNRKPLLSKDIKYKVLNHIMENAKNKSIYIDLINGSNDHLHCLISLKAEQNISKVIQLIKGESSYWINKNKITPSKFEWADEYFAVSISDSDISNVKRYIKNQEEHHRKKTWQNEYDDFMNKYCFVEYGG